MKYSEKDIDLLRDLVGQRLSQKRFLHTIGVESMAVKIGEKCLPESIDLLRIAALLHDISKEYSEAEHFELLKKHNITISEYELSSPALWHSITAPLVVADDFPEFADRQVLSATRRHTVGSPDMGVLDEIILLADYIEEGRRYEACIDLREKFLAELCMADDRSEAVLALHRAVAASLDNTINELMARGRLPHESSALTRDAVLAKLERH